MNKAEMFNYELNITRKCIVLLPIIFQLNIFILISLKTI